MSHEGEICIWTTHVHDEHLVVFNVLQNLVGIDAVVLIICRFNILCISPEKNLFTPPNLAFWGI